MSGTEIGDASLGVVSQHLGLLEELDLRACVRVTDAGLEMLVTPGRPLLLSLCQVNLCRCLAVTDAGLPHLAALQRLKRLDVTRIPGVTREGCSRFLQGYTWRPLTTASPGVIAAVVE